MAFASVVRKSLLLCFPLLAAVPGPATAGPPAPSAASPAVQAAITAVVEQERKTYGGNSPVPGVLIGVWDGAGAHYIHGFGTADLATGRTLTADEHFRIGSNTKTFVVAVLLQLVDEGKISLDDPLSKFDVGVTVPNASHITLRQLCNMRSGLFEAYDVPELQNVDFKPDQTFDPRTIIKWAVAQKPYFAPGAGYHYSNTNYLLLGLVIEDVTKRKLADEIRSRLLTPFHLTQTSIPADQTMPAPFAHGYALNKEKNWEDVSSEIPISLTGAAGDMISTMNDMQRWIKIYVSGGASAAATHAALIDCIPTGSGNLAFGLGLGCSDGWLGYTGGLPGYNTADYYLPAQNITIVAWVTTQANDPPPGVANAIFRDIAHIMAPDTTPFDLGTAKHTSGL
jgi:D-alanyl-D-alanine carboxypeptidase